MQRDLLAQCNYMLEFVQDTGVNAPTVTENPTTI